MLNKIYETELLYVKCFSESIEEANIIRFQDNKLLDMYCHNFTFIQNQPDDSRFMEMLMAEVHHRRAMKYDFLRIETNFTLEDRLQNTLPMSPDISNYDYMQISTAEYAAFRGNPDAVILEAVDDKTLKDGVIYEISGSEPKMIDFTLRKTARKLEAYSATDNQLHWYVCYCNGKVIGSCELFINGDIAKIEEFSILEDYQRKGFGTAVLKHLLREAHGQGVHTAYLITDSADTAKDMYAKCGFQKVGEKTAAFFKL